MVQEQGPVVGQELSPVDQVVVESVVDLAVAHGERRRQLVLRLLELHAEEGLRLLELHAEEDFVVRPDLPDFHLLVVESLVVESSVEASKPLG